MFQCFGRIPLIITVAMLSGAQPTALAATAGNKFKTVASFSSAEARSSSHSALALGSDGALYGARTATDLSCGVIYRVRPREGITVIHDFADGALGCSPVGKLLYASDGHFYGVTLRGGAEGLGVVYRFDPNGDYAVVASFTDSPYICWPRGELLEGEDGLIYGTSECGGEHSGGTIFSVSKDGQVQLLHSFDDHTGRDPNGELLQLGDGSLVGTTNSGGRHGYGLIFKNDRHGGHATLHHFTGKQDGVYPMAGLTLGIDGKLYGTTVASGRDNGGSVYRIDADGSNFQVLHRAKSATGLQSRSRLVQVPDGNLLGTMTNGGLEDDSGNGFGVVFSISTSGKYRVLVRFDGDAMGRRPITGLTDVDNGLFFGLTEFGGENDLGTVFRFAYP